MDTLDKKILECLQKNARQSASDIGKTIHLSVSTVIDRIRKLEASGIIQHYTAVLDEKKLGNDVTALMEVSLEHPRNCEAFTNSVVSNSSITACYYLAADFDFLLKIVCRSSMQLEEIHRFIKIQPGVSSTRTHYVLKDVKHTYSPIWEELPDSHR